MRLIPKTAVLELVPYTIQHIYRLEKAGKFPKRLRIGANRVAWVHAEIIDWIKQRAEQRQLPSSLTLQMQVTHDTDRISRNIDKTKTARVTLAPTSAPIKKSMPLSILTNPGVPLKN